jgi:hypothetical protein
MKKILFLIIIISGITYSQDKTISKDISAQEIKDHVYFLASDEMKGRFTGSAEELLAAEYIKSCFEAAGLKPLFNGSWFQEFSFIEKVELSNKNAFNYSPRKKKNLFALNSDFTVIGFSGNTTVSAPIVFAGYGISAPTLNYDDYSGIDVKDKIVLVMRNHPDHDSSRSAFDRFASLRNKAKIAQEKGALGIIFVNGIYPKNEDALPNPRYDGARAMNDFAVVQAKRDLISELLSDNGFDFEAIQKNIDLNKKPNSFLIENLSAQITTDLKEVEKIARNVGGMLEGNDPLLKNEVVVVGGHYDHLGIDQLSESSMYKGTDKQIHNGADDNASGTAGVIEVAEKLAFMKDKIKRTYYFTAFSGEELGLLGSAYLTNNFPTDISNTAAMLNMDMIGRINEENNLTVIGAGTSSKWKDILNAKNSYDLKLAFSDGGSGGSDHQAFSNKNIPVLFFFTGTHTDYHKPSDDADKINYPGQEKVLNFVFDVALALDELTEKPDYVKVAEPTNRGMGRSRVSIGTVPEFGWNGEGYKLSGVTEGGSAAKAGLKSGDIIVKFGTKKVSNIYDFMYAVQDFKPGDTVDVVVLRDGKEETFSLELVAR